MNLEDYFENELSIPAERLREAMESSCLETMSIARDVFVYHRKRINGRFADDSVYNFLISYYVLCMKNELSTSDRVHKPFEAAHELVRLFETLAFLQSKKAKFLLTRIVDSITGMYQVGGKLVRNLIETGFLDHVFEINANRRFFEHWKYEPFREAYFASLSWGKNHERKESNPENAD